MEEQREFAFTAADFECVRGLVKRYAGISLSDAKRDMVYSRLSRRLRQLGLGSFDAYCQILEDGDPDELVQFTNAITTNLTAFFRENHHFQYLANTLIPQLIERKGTDRRVRAWSAGCSSGEEAYSLAMVLKERLPESGWDVKLLATDLDSNVLGKAEAGIYSAERARGVSGSRLQRWFLKGTGRNAGSIRVRPELKRLITFKRLNLLDAWPFKSPFDFIFCRNVVIYFDRQTQARLFDRFAAALTAGDHLFIGHSESLFRISERFELIGKTIYRKLR